MTYLESITLKNSASNHRQNEGKIEENDNPSSEHQFVLSQREAEAASPENFAVCGEEDPGEGLEFLVVDEDIPEITSRTHACPVF